MSARLLGLPTHLWCPAPCLHLGLQAHEHAVPPSSMLSHLKTQIPLLQVIGTDVDLLGGYVTTQSFERLSDVATCGKMKVGPPALHNKRALGTCLLQSMHPFRASFPPRPRTAGWLAGFLVQGLLRTANTPPGLACILPSSETRPAPLPLWTAAQVLKMLLRMWSGQPGNKVRCCVCCDMGGRCARWACALVVAPDRLSQGASAPVAACSAPASDFLHRRCFRLPAWPLQSSLRRPDALHADQRAFRGVGTPRQAHWPLCLASRSSPQQPCAPAASRRCCCSPTRCVCSTSCAPC